MAAKGGEHSRMKRGGIPPRHQNALLIEFRKARLKAGMSKERLGKAIGFDGMQIHHWEQGKHSPSLTNAQAWAGGLALVLTLSEPKAE